MPRGPAIFLLALLLAGCGSAEPVREPDATIELAIRDFRVAPQVVRAPGRQDLTIIVRNTGRLPHNLRIRGTGGNRVKFRTLLPGESAARVVKLPRGDWRMFCSLSNHEELGLYGTLVLR
jgi:hypothetical protein